jgi:hypothetical protein
MAEQDLDPSRAVDMHLIVEQATLAKTKSTGIHRCFAPHGEGEVGLSSLIKTMSKEQKHTQQRAEALPNDFRVEKNQWQEEIFEYLCQRNRFDDSYPFFPNTHHVAQPNTVTYKYQRPNGWYSTQLGGHEDGIVRKKDKNKELSAEEILKGFAGAKANRSGVVACWVSSEHEAGCAPSSTVEYLDWAGLERFLVEKERPNSGYS